MKRLLPLLGLGLLLGACTSPIPPDKEFPWVKLELKVPLKDSPLGVVQMQAQATDNVGVKEVRFYLESKLLDVDATSPYEVTDMQSKSGTYHYRAVAVDAAGNTAESTLDVSLDLPAGISALSGTVVEAVSVPLNSELVTQAWTGGAGQVILSTAAAEVARADLKADGTFTLELPALPDSGLHVLGAADLGAQSCTSQPSFSTSGVRGTVADMAVQASKSGPVFPLTSSVTSVNGVPKEWYIGAGVLVYVDRLVTVSGSATCNLTYGGPATIQYQLNLLPGWNRVNVKTTVNVSGTIGALVTAGLPGNNWVYGVGSLLP